MHCAICLQVTVVFAIMMLAHSYRRVPRDVINTFLVKNRAQQKACGINGKCPSECRNYDGWNLRGSDWGCCGNYEGCCTMASIICWTHDIICRCCDYGMFLCGPFCKKDASCYEQKALHSSLDETEKYKEHSGMKTVAGLTMSDDGPTMSDKVSGLMPDDTPMAGDTPMMSDAAVPSDDGSGDL